MNHGLDNDTHDLDWMAGQQPQRISAEPFVAGDPFARERAMQALVRHIDSDGGRGDSRLRRLLRPRTLVFATATGAAALLAVAILTSGGGDTHAGGTHAGGGHVGVAAKVAAGGGTHQPLMHLADYVSKSPEPTGNATLVQRTTTLEGKTATVYDLYADDGRYFFGESKGELAGAIEAGKNTAGGWTARQLAAAEEANSGSLAAAAEDMASAAIPKHRYRAGTANYPNRVWEESEQALITGAGQPQIRAGVLKILGTLPGVAVTKGALAGSPTLVLTAGAEEMGTGYQEQLTIDADTGVPIEFTGGVPNGPPLTRVEYQVSRADYAGLAAPAGSGATE